jgi:alkylated DNA repair protein alkB homolog 7
MRYQNNHWDFAIQGFKEIELLDESLLHPVSQLALKKTRSFLLSHHLAADSTFLPCHVIDLGQNGMLRPHVDSVRFSGGLVAGVSLMSPSIMRLKPAVEAYGDRPEGLVDLLLPRLSLYVLSGVSRYKYTHELLESGACFEDNEGMRRQIERDSRVSVIFRDSKQTEGQLIKVFESFLCACD